MVLAVQDHDGRFLVVRHNTVQSEWGFIQGKIEVKDAHPYAAGEREGWEEANIDASMIDRTFPYLGEARVNAIDPMFDAAFTMGGYYIWVGIRLKPGATIDLRPPDGHPLALLAYRWLPEDDAITFLRTQPGICQTVGTIQKTEHVLIPAMQAMTTSDMPDLLRILTPIS